MRSFEFKMPAKVKFGEGIVKEIGSILRGMGYHKAFIATDKGIVAAGICAMIEEGLKAETAGAPQPHPWHRLRRARQASGRRWLKITQNSLRAAGTRSQTR